MIVKTQEVCARCRRITETEMDMAVAQELAVKELQAQKFDQELETRFNEFVAAFDSQGHAQVIVAVKQPDGQYEVKTLRNLCSRKGEARVTGCEVRVNALLGDVFTRSKVGEDEVTVPTQKRPRKGKKAAEPQAE